MLMGTLSFRLSRKSVNVDLRPWEALFKALERQAIAAAADETSVDL